MGPGKDFAWAASPYGPTQKFMSIWRTPKPVIAQVHGWCVGGGSDMALCADLVIASEDAQIGTPYSRIWGCYLSGMWLYRLGLTKAKEHALTGKPLSGREAADVELINAAVPFEQLEAAVAAQAEQLASIPSSQLAAMKLVVNQAYENMGLRAAQTLGPILDGLMRNTPDGLGVRGAGDDRRRSRRHRGARRAIWRLQRGRRRRPARPESRDHPGLRAGSPAASRRRRRRGCSRAPRRSR